MKENEPYIDDDCLIEDEYYNNVKDTIKCEYCKQILKQPMMCKECMKTFCNKCTKNSQKKKDKKDKKGHNCKKAKYTDNITANKIMSKLKYLCKNCKNEIKKEDIENHLKEGCETNENPSGFLDCIFRKKALRQLNQEEIKALNNKKKNHLSGKIINIINIFCFSSFIRKSFCRKVIIN